MLPFFPVDQGSDEWQLLAKVAARGPIWQENRAGMPAVPWLVYSNNHPAARERKMQGWRAENGPF
jgi:hypothetical protein